MKVDKALYSYQPLHDLPDLDVTSSSRPIHVLEEKVNNVY